MANQPTKRTLGVGTYMAPTCVAPHIIRSKQLKQPLRLLPSEASQ